MASYQKYGKLMNAVFILQIIQSQFCDGGGWSEEKWDRDYEVRCTQVEFIET